MFPRAPLLLCDGIDNNCDGQVDEGVLLSWYAATDGDGFGDPAALNEACEPGPGETPNSDDCDDGSPAIYPGAPEVCDGLDNNCNGVADDGGAVLTYADRDGDGYGAPDTALEECEATSGRELDATDCNDTDDAVHPAAEEACHGLDDNCDGVVDGPSATDATSWFTDADADGYGDPATVVVSCAAPTGMAADGSDCDDTSAAVNPGADEVCNSTDDDCDGLVDDDDGSLDAATGSTFYSDLDGDTYGDASAAVQACIQPSGTVTDTTDCDDGSATVYPGATELCNLVDDDCDGTVDDGVMGSALACPAQSCLDILVDQPSSSTGTYVIDFDGTATSTTCDMTTDGGGWTLVFDDDFESTPDTGWSTSATYACGGWSTILGGYGNTAGTEIDIVIDIYDIAHTQAWLELEYIALDSRDGELAYVTADGTTLFSQYQSNHSTSYSEVCGWDRGYEGSYDSSWTIDDTLSHTAGDLELIAGSTLDQDPSDESFGLDDVMLWVR